MQEREHKVIAFSFLAVTQIFFKWWWHNGTLHTISLALLLRKHPYVVLFLFDQYFEQEQIHFNTFSELSGFSCINVNNIGNFVQW